jgi:Protein of unknown function (DUF1761)
MKQFLISVVVMFILSLGLGFVVHGVLLKDDYAKLTGLMRDEAGQQQHFPAMLAAHVVLALGVTALYRRGRQMGEGWLTAGVCFGALLVVVACIPTYLIYYAVEPMPGALVVKQIAFDAVATLVLGVAVAALNREQIETVESETEE